MSRTIVGCVAVWLCAAQVAHGQGACAWSPLGAGVDGAGLLVGDLIVHDEDGPSGLPPALFVCGTFNNAGGIPVSSVARWDGTSWSGLGTGVGPGAVVWELTTFDEDGPGGNPPVLIAGGSPGTGSLPGGIARWDGNTWSAVGSGVSGASAAVRCLAVFDEDGPGGAPPVLFLGGTFTTAGGIATGLIARWDGTSYSTLAGGLSGGLGQCNALVVYDDGTGPALYATGSFTNAGGVACSDVARWDGTTWSALGSGLVSNGSSGRVAAVFDDGNGPGLYVGGFFQQAGGVPTGGIARWDGTTWSSPQGGVTGSTVPLVAGLAVYDDGSSPGLYAGGTFTTAGGVAASRIARWDGAVWSPLGSGLTGPGTLPTVTGLAVFDDGTGPGIYAHGTISTAGGAPASNIARWSCGTGLSISSTQPGGPGTPVLFNNANLSASREYFNLFSIEPCPGGPGTGPGPFGACITTLGNNQFIISQLLTPIGAAPFHFIAPDGYQSFGPFILPPLMVDAIILEIGNGTITASSPMTRLTVQ